MSTTQREAQRVLAQIQARLLTEAERAICAAEHYQHSKRAGERNSVPVYIRRAEATLPEYSDSRGHR